MAVIKWMLIKKDFAGALKIRTKGKYTIVSLPNGQCWSFTKKEIAELNKDNAIGFRRNRGEHQEQIKGIKRFVQLCFAVLVRNMQLYGYQGKEFTKTAAIHALTKEGIDTSRFHELLGLKRTPAKKITQASLQRIKKQQVVLLYNRKHIVVMSGNYYDDYGKARPVNDIPLLCGEKATNWYSLK